jgi:signal transduction histidine kinase
MPDCAAQGLFRVPRLRGGVVGTGASVRWGNMTEAWRRLSCWFRDRTSGVVILALVMLLSATGMFSPLTLGLTDFWFKAFGRPASGDVVVVQIDARSLMELDTWPWPRSRHAQVLDRLKEAGAEVVAFDIDFSSGSAPAEDEALSRSISAAAGKVVLASLVQPTGLEKPALVETLPIAAFRANAVTGVANIFAERGLARDASLTLMGPDGHPQPAFAALVAGTRHADDGLFSIDYSIDVKTIPHLSYVDVLKGKFDPGAVRGKKVVIGATAVELGDRVSVPVHGVIAGADLQALITESILQDRMLVDAGLTGQMTLVLLTILFLRPWRLRWNARVMTVAGGSALAALLGASALVFHYAGYLLDPLAGCVSIIACFAWAGFQELASRSKSVLRERSTSSLRQMMITLIVEDSSDGIVVVRDNGRIELCNEQAARLLNVTRRTLAGRTVSGFLPTFETIAPADTAESEPLRSCDLKLDGPGGGFLVEMSVRRTRTDGFDGPEGLGSAYLDTYTLRDVTLVRKARAAEERAQEERLLAERAKSNFVANMSHELRTPLNAIIGFSEMLSNEILGPVQQRAYVEHAEIVVRSSHHLLSVVNNVIDVARLDSDLIELSREELSLADLIDSASGLVRALTSYKEHDIRVAVAPEVARIVSDPRLLKQVIYNLLSNAVKFSPEGSRVTCSAWIERTDVVIEIEDQGCGIDAAAIPRLAALFGHAESAFSRPHDGLGVGLHLVKRCLEKLDGRLSFQTGRGEGTRVRVVLPSGSAVEQGAPVAALAG